MSVVTSISALAPILFLVRTNRPPSCSLFHLCLSDPVRWNTAEWLSPLNFKPIHSEIFQHRGKGTGQWLLESEEFKFWRDGPPDALWCPGIRAIPLLINAQLFSLTDLSSSGCWKDNPRVRTMVLWK